QDEQTEANIESNTTVRKSTEMPSVCTAASVKIDMVTAAPHILIVAPSGIEIEYVSFSRPSMRHRLMFTGMFAAELLVKNPVMALSRNTVNTSGYGFWRMAMNTMSGFKTNATKSIQPIKSINRLP